MIRELVMVTPIEDHPAEGLAKGDMGTVVMAHEGGKAFEIEFVTLAGDPLGVLNCELIP